MLATVAVLGILSVGLAIRQIYFSDARIAFEDLDPEIQTRILELQNPAREAFELAPVMQVYRNEALDYYGRILDLHPDNENAQTRIEELGDLWVVDIQKTLDDGNTQVAADQFEELLVAYPHLRQHAKLEALKQRIDGSRN